MSSKSTDKPTGPCAACQKEGASRRCIPCRDVGVDIFFCNRDCQSKRWKNHKAVCGQAATTDDLIPPDASSEKKRAKSFRKFLCEFFLHFVFICILDNSLIKVKLFDYFLKFFNSSFL